MGIFPFSLILPLKYLILSNFRPLLLLLVFLKNLLYAIFIQELFGYRKNLNANEFTISKIKQNFFFYFLISVLNLVSPKTCT
jgi:hypothetical protein